MLTHLQYIFLGFYTLVLLMLSVYGLHRYHLVYLYYRNRKKEPRATGRFDLLPRVTIQLPMFNERFVARRVIERCCQIDYPRDRVQIQVLDDSTDQTRQIAQSACDEFRAAGFDIDYIHRDSRAGFKAGALDYGLTRATGEFIAIFDADFVPEPDILHRTVHYFTDPAIGMVQARWSHINRDDSLLTKSQAILLDSHFMIEKTARNRSGRFVNFSGTAGIWRRQSIADAGGWQHDTLTEDLDLSYRAQLAGWKFVFLPDVTSPAELPPEMTAFKHQQYRWTKGTVQTAVKLLPRILKSRLPLAVKTEAFFHLTSCMTYVLMVLLTLMLFPAFALKFSLDNVLGSVWSLLIDLTLFLVATCSATTFYLCSQQEIYRDWRDKIKYLPFLMSLGVGICLSNSKAVLAALLGRKSEFVRTPKFGASSGRDRSWKERAAFSANPDRGRRQVNWMPYVEFLFGCYVAVCVYLAVITPSRATISLPFLCMFMCGYFYVSLATLVGGRTGPARKQGRKVRQPGPAAAASWPGPTVEPVDVARAKH